MSAVFPLVPRRRVLGLAFGGVRSVRRGIGTDVASTRVYHPGDDVGWMDWAASAKRSRTMNSSVPRAADSRADAAQSIQPTSSPGMYSRVLAMSEPTPRRALRTPPKASPITRRRGTSGKTVATGA